MIKLNLNIRLFVFTTIIILISGIYLSAPARVSANFSEEQQITPSDGFDGDFYGQSVSLSADGDRYAVGSQSADGDVGAVYIYSRSGNTWTQEQKITPGDGAAGDEFGHAVSLSGDGSRLAVGSWGADGNNGAIYIYSRSGITWTLEQRLVASDPVSGDELGNSVSISSDGTRVAGGAFGWNADFYGAVYVFSRLDTTWTQEQKITDVADTARDYFGFSVSLSDDGTRMGIGAYGVNSAQGATYIYSRSVTTWTLEQTLTASLGIASDNFGSAVALAGEDASRIIIGAAGYNSSNGAGYIFSRSGATWTQEQRITASDGVGGDSLGNSATMSGDGSKLTIASWAKNNTTGALYVFSRSDTTWTEDQELTGSAEGDFFGWSNAISEDGLRIGVSSPGASSFQGASLIYLFDAPPTLSSLSPLNSSTKISLDNDFTLTFSEPVNVGTGNIVINKAKDDSVFQTIPVASVSGDGTDTITIPHDKLRYGTEYYVTIDDTAFTDLNDNAFAGISDSSTWSFTTKSAPTSGGSVSSAPSVVVVPPTTNTPEVPAATVCKPGELFSATTGLPCSSSNPGPVTPGADHSSTCFITSTLKQGSTGNQVKCLQSFLNITSDGIFGPITKAAVVSFQKAHFLEIDGIVGPKTRGAMGF